MHQTQAQQFAPELGFKDIVTALWRRKIMIVVIFVASVALANYATSKMKTRWKATAQMIVIQRGPTISSSTEASYSAPLVESADTQVEMIQSGSMVQRAMDWMRNEAFNKRQTLEQMGITDTHEIESQFPSLITVVVPKETNLLVLSATGPTSEQATSLANATCAAFVDWKKEIAQASVREMATNLEDRAKRANQQMLQAEQEETDFKRKRQLVDVPSQLKVALDQYLQHENEVISVKQELNSEEERARALESQLKDINGAIRNGTGVRDDSQAQELQKQLNALEIEKAEAELKYTAEYPGILPDLNARIKDVQARLSRAIQETLNNKRPSLTAQNELNQSYKQSQVTLAFTQAKLTAAIALRDQFKRPLASIPGTSMEYARVARKAELARQLSSSLQASLNAVKLNKDSVDGNVRITSAAVQPNLPFYPVRSRNLLMGGVLGLAIAVPLALLLEGSNGRTRNTSDVRRLAQGPIIGVLPRMSRAQTRQLEEGIAPPIAREVFNHARANLAMITRASLQGDPWKNKVILITSAVPGEGKSLTAANFARTLARSGKTVILIDADLRRPRQSHLFADETNYGLADVLVRNMPYEAALVPSDTENLFLLHSGATSRNPTELISLPKMAEALQAYRKAADVVIVDTPACAVVADALFLAPYADCIMQVIGVGKAEQELVRETTATLRAAGGSEVVVFINHGQREARHAYSKYYTKQDDTQDDADGGAAAGPRTLSVPSIAQTPDEPEEKGKPS